MARLPIAFGVDHCAAHERLGEHLRSVAVGSRAGGCHGVVTCLQARQDRKVEPPRDKMQDCRSVIKCMIDEAFPGERRTASIRWR
jgi:hypothetical protein